MKRVADWRTGRQDTHERRCVHKMGVSNERWTKLPQRFESPKSDYKRDDQTSLTSPQNIYKIISNDRQDNRQPTEIQNTCQLMNEYESY